MLIGGMLAVWLLHARADARRRRARGCPRASTIPEVAVERDADRRPRRSACSPSGRSTPPAATTGRTPASPSASSALIGVAVINAQAFVYNQMELPIADERLRRHVLRRHRHDRWRCSIVGVVFTGVTAFRFLGGRIRRREIVAAHALYWYVLAAVFSAVWLVVYVTK